MSLEPKFQLSCDNHNNAPIIVRWNPKGFGFAVACSNNKLIHYDNTGRVIEEKEVDEGIRDICWDRDGRTLAIASATKSWIYLWNVAKRTTDMMESHLCGNDELPTCLSWSVWSLDSPTLVIGNDQGYLTIFDQKTGKRRILEDKHQSVVIELTILPGDLIFSCSDGTLSINRMFGLNVSSCKVKGKPSMLDHYVVSGENGRPQIMVSAVIEKKFLFLAPSDNMTSSQHITFQERYGEIKAYSWYNSSQILVGFETGFVVMVSAKDPFGAEINCFREFETNLSGLVVDKTLKHYIAIGDKSVKVRKLDVERKVEEKSLGSKKNLDGLQLAKDGKSIAISNCVGALSVFRVA
ncbi:unnamed protein product [Caenorhabditis sp. 36 PRJEB53466]|nr:unnamed protein product [Caenorhabditis sp. 36 PRJEB53466]